MTDNEVDDLLALMEKHYERFRASPGDRLIWQNALANADAERTMTVLGELMARGGDAPTVAELNAAVHRHYCLTPRMRGLAWAAYEAECRKQGRAPTSLAFSEEILASGQQPPGSRRMRG